MAYDKEQRFSLRLPADLNDRARDYADGHGISKNDLLNESLRFYLDVKTGLVDFNDLALQRLNQIQDSLEGLTFRQSESHDALNNIVKLLLRYTAGENYLDDEDSDLAQDLKKVQDSKNTDQTNGD